MTETQGKLTGYCLEKNGAYPDWPFGEDVTVIKVKAPSQEKGRIFAQFFTLKDKPCATFNCSAETGYFYRSVYPGSVTRGYHCPPVQQPYFNTVSLDGTVPYGELLLMIDHAYETVLKKLPNYIQKELCLKGTNRYGI